MKCISFIVFAAILASLFSPIVSADVIVQTLGSEGALP